jgi:hypothetical protein
MPQATTKTTTTTAPKVSTSISINRKLLARLRKEARASKRSVSSQLEILIEDALATPPA